MSKPLSLEPPQFIDDNKTYAQYKDDLQMWSRISGIEKKSQAETVVYRLEGHPSRIKEKIMNQIGDKIKDSDDGIKVLIEFLDTIYDKDEMADIWDKYTEFSSYSRKADQDVSQFMSEWTNSYHKLKTAGCTYPDIILGFKLLDDAKLDGVETKLVLTGVDFKKAKEDKNLEQQIKDSLKKFKGRSVITSSGGGNLSVDVKSEPTWLSEMEEVLITKGWKPPIKKGPRRRSRSESPKRTKKVTFGSNNNTSNYKGKKNPLGDNRKPLKCFLCKCEHTDNCTCPCVYHLADTCPKKKNNEQKKPELGFFLETNLYPREAQTYFVNDNTDEDDDELVLVVRHALDKLILLTVDTIEAVVDCACPTTVSGESWMQKFCEELDETSKRKIKIEESNRMFKFGGGEKRKSKGLVTFPCHLAGKNINMRSEVVEAEFPLLLGNSMLKKAGAVLHLAESKAVLMGNEVPMRETTSGHFTLKISSPNADLPFEKNCYVDEDPEMRISQCLLSSNDELSREDVVKLHHMFGHVSIKKLCKLIENSKRMTENVKGYLDDVERNCKSCKVKANAKPHPVVSLPRASRFNQVVTMDLKHYQCKQYNFIVYFVDLFSRLTVGAFINNKLPSTVGEKVLDKWISVFGRMKVLHSDRGGEFCCSELTDVAEYIGVLSSFTAASSPHQNGVNERNHAICDRMMDKMLLADPQLPVEVALTWALTAKNTLQNVSGFSPFQIVFGENPSLPSVFTAGPPGFEEVVMNKAVANHINALFLGREAFMAIESDRILKAALKQRIYKRGENIVIGDWIYFQQKGRWNGPVKVIGKDGKSLYVVRGGKLLTINSDDSQLAEFEGKLIPSSVDPKESQGGQSSESSDIGGKVPVKLIDDGKEEANADMILNKTNDEEICGEKIKLKPNLVVKLQKTPNEEWSHVKIINRGGKSTGKYKNWWNLQNVNTGHKSCENFDDVHKYEVVEGNKDDGEEISNDNAGNNSVTGSEDVNCVFVTTIPRYRHYEEACKAAKEKELDSWDQYNVYEEVADVGQVRIGTNWLLTEKLVKAATKSKIKARLTVRGDQEETLNVQKDSPTVRKSNIKVFAAVAAKEHWVIRSSDVASAFLQGIAIDRDVFVVPPKERRIPGVIWKLLKPVYGLVDAPRGWHLALDAELLKAGCEKCYLDPSMYLKFSVDEVKKTIEGMVLTHVDDLLNGGCKYFENNVMPKVKAAFNFGTDEAETFCYTGMNMTQTEMGIVIDHDHYVQSLELPDMEIAKGQKMEDTLNPDGQTLFRGCVSKILYIGYQSRPDVCFDAKCLSTKFGKAKKGDLKSAMKKIQKLQGQRTQMVFPDMGPIEDWCFIGYGDAGIRSMPDKVSSVGGVVLLLANEKKNVACVLMWRSKKLVRKVVSSLAGEALACQVTIGELVYIKAVFEQIYGQVVNNVPSIVFTDSKNLSLAVFGSSLVDDAWLIPDIAIIKEALEQGTITCLRRVSSEEMLANCLTKAGCSSDGLMEVLQTGHYVIPAGLDD